MGSELLERIAKKRADHDSEKEKEQAVGLERAHLLRLRRSPGKGKRQLLPQRSPVSGSPGGHFDKRLISWSARSRNRTGMACAEGF